MKKIKLITLLALTLISCKDESQKLLEKSSYENLDKAKKLRISGSIDSSYVYYAKAKEGLLSINDKVEAARALTNLAIIENDKGDYHASITSSIEAEKLLQNKNDSISKSIASPNYNSIAIASKNLKNFKDAIEYYNRAISISDNKVDSLSFYNNIGDSYLEQHDIKSAKIFFQRALQTTDSIDYARALNNLAKTKFIENNNYNPIPELLQAWKIRKHYKDNIGINSSLATIADYYIIKDKTKALSYAGEMYKIATQNKSPDDRIEALNKLIRLDPENHSENFHTYSFLTDSLHAARNNSKNQFALIRFGNEKLKTDIVRNEKRIMVLSLALGIVVLVTIIVSLWYKKRKEIEVKNTQLKMSKKVHDKVANKVYHVMSEVENTPDMDKETILDKLEGIYKISRDISYEDKDNILEANFSKQLSEMIKSYASENIKIPIIGNDESLWDDVPDNTKVELFYIIQELMTNMKKHSNADRVLINFERENNFITIIYSDNGIGMHTLLPKNGLQNTDNRINSVGGTINFDTKAERGLKITLSFPVKN
ncbi:tetratricopeptide repeat-containing sensor histidine kinase [Chryseobacterium phocaeense]|uniref:tetratricopeptide repeat-containing sensor histidine kinase n=1 Tax=Chryseobacterium phocaeense TaxID=1816690 RepID=UPI00111A9311|nr:tetratricopeptide repeat-containing sensor histidine kinase [Chryseobacterium phocaeense]